MLPQYLTQEYNHLELLDGAGCCSPKQHVQPDILLLGAAANVPAKTGQTGGRPQQLGRQCEMQRPKATRSRMLSQPLVATIGVACRSSVAADVAFLLFMWIDTP